MICNFITFFIIIILATFKGQRKNKLIQNKCLTCLFIHLAKVSIVLLYHFSYSHYVSFLLAPQISSSSIGRSSTYNCDILTKETWKVIGPSKSVEILICWPSLLICQGEEKPPKGSLAWGEGSGKPEDQQRPKQGPEPLLGQPPSLHKNWMMNWLRLIM